MNTIRITLINCNLIEFCGIKDFKQIQRNNVLLMKIQFGSLRHEWIQIHFRSFIYAFFIHFYVHVSRILRKADDIEGKKMLEIWIRTLNLLLFSLEPDIHIFCGDYHPLRKWHTATACSDQRGGGTLGRVGVVNDKNQVSV